MIDWSFVDWDMVWKIAGATWGVTVLVCSIGWLVAWVVGLALRKTAKPTTEGKEGSSKG